MRAALFLATFLLAACDGGSRAPSSATTTDAATGEVTTRIVARGEAAVTMRSGLRTPVILPAGFTLYPGAQVVSNTLVEREGSRRVLLVFETPDPLAKVMTFHRGQAEAAGLMLTLDLGGAEQASIGGRLLSGGELAITVRQGPAATRVEFAHN